MADKENDDLRSEDTVQAKAKQAIEQLGPDVVRCIREGFRRPRGRPKGSGAIDDSSRLLDLALLLESGKAKSMTEASRMIAQKDPGHSVDSTAQRLRRKFRPSRDELHRRAREILREQRESEEHRVSQEQPNVSKENARRPGSGHSHSRSTGAPAIPFMTGGSGWSGRETLTTSSMIPRYLTEPISTSVELQDLTCLATKRLPSDGLNDLMAASLRSIQPIRSEAWADLCRTSSLSSQLTRTGILDADVFDRIGRISRLISPWKL